MNERIKQLEKDALYFALQFRAGLNGDLTDYETEIIFREKFAQLIVRECIDILPEKVKIDDLYDGKILVQCGMAIKQHFGVED